MSSWCEQNASLCNSALFSPRSVWLPVVVSFVGVIAVVAAFCRWRGIRRRRELDRLERLQQAEDDSDERFVDYEEKPTVFDVSINQTAQFTGGWSSLKPVSVWCDMDQDPATQSTKPHDETLLRLASEQVAEFQSQVRKLRARMRKLNGHQDAVEELKDLKLDLVSVAFLVSLPCDENEDDALPHLVIAIQDPPVAG